MADKKPDKKGDKKPSGGGVKSDMDVLSTIGGIVIALIIISALVSSFQNRFAGGEHIDLDVWARQGLFFFSSRINQYTTPGTLVATRGMTDVWASAFRERILGVQERNASGRLLSYEVIGGEVWWSVDFDVAPDGWVLSSDVKKRFEGTVAGVRRWFLWISGILSILGAFLALYSWRQWMFVTRTHRAQMQELEKKLVEKDIANKNERWEKVEHLIASDNPGDWRIAIIEADVMLDELVTAMGYDGDTLGDKLKAIEQSDFTTLNEAWEAHKVRNRIAHSGSDFILTHREAKRVIALFHTVFQEFDYV